MGLSSLDVRGFGAINRLPHTPRSDGYIRLISDLGEGAGWVVASAWLALRGGGRGRRAAVATTVTMLAAVNLAQGPIKQAFQRARPADPLRILVGNQLVDHSFPSGHTAGSFAAASCLAVFSPRDRPMLLAAATAVGLSRIYLGHHFPSDVLAGAALGTAIGLAGARLARVGPPRPPYTSGNGAGENRG